MQVLKPNYKRRKPKKGKRGEFSPQVKQDIFDHFNGMCKQCKRPGEEIHHIRFKSRGGRGVFTNGLLLCRTCHANVHASGEITQFWIDYQTDLYGTDFYKDEFDE